MTQRTSDRRLYPPSGGRPAPVEAALGPDPTVPLLPLAREICRRYREEFPDEEARYGDAGNAWCVHDNQYLLSWAAGAVQGDIDLEHKVSWLADVLEARDFPLARLARNLDLGAQVVAEQVPGASGQKLATTLAHAATSLRHKRVPLGG